MEGSESVQIIKDPDPGCLKTYGWDLAERLKRLTASSEVASCNCLGFFLSILRHSGIWGAADEAVKYRTEETKLKGPDPETRDPKTWVDGNLAANKLQHNLAFIWKLTIINYIQNGNITQLLCCAVLQVVKLSWRHLALASAYLVVKWLVRYRYRTK